MKTKNYYYIYAILFTGFLSGMGVIFLKYLINLAQNIFFLGELSLKYNINFDYHAKSLGALILIIPVIGSIIVTFLIKNFAVEAQGHGVPQVIFSIRYNKSFIRPIVALIKSLASAISIGSGGSSGMEGPIVQIGATLGSMQSIIFKNLTEVQKATLVACGASAGFAAAFNSPLSGVLFAIEMLLPIIAIETVVPLMVAVAIAVFLNNITLSNNAYFPIHETITHGSPADLYQYCFLGVITGIGAAIFIRILDALEEYVERYKMSSYLKHALGMFFVGLILFLVDKYTGHYYVGGSGYLSMYKILHQDVGGLKLLLVLFVLKMLVTLFTLGSGASGGIFSPSLFMGACLGGCFHIIAKDLNPDLDISYLNFILAGMGGMLAGVTGMTLTAVLIILEITHCFNVALPIIITIASSSITRTLFVKESLYHSRLNKQIAIHLLKMRK